MDCLSRISGKQLNRRAEPGLHLVEFPRKSYRETYITVSRLDGESDEAMFARAAALVRADDISVVSQEIFGVADGDGAGRRLLTDAFGEPAWPVTWIEEGCDAPGAPGGMQIWAISGLPVRPIAVNGDVLGVCFEDECAQYCRLGGLLPIDTSIPNEEQAAQVFEQMARALADAEMDFGHVIRTWFYNHDILSWYREFNLVRDRFFREWGVFDALVPASTAVGGRNSKGAALVCELIAVKPKCGCVNTVPLPSPLQCPALDYGSSFSRAVELSMPDHRRVLVSGTASIDPDGHTVHLDDVDGQIALTMDVAYAILESRGMSWDNVTRALIYFKHAKDMPAFDRYRKATGLDGLAVLAVNDEVCRDNLLFEIELDAVSTAD